MATSTCGGAYHHKCASLGVRNSRLGSDGTWGTWDTKYSFVQRATGVSIPPNSAALGQAELGFAAGPVIWSPFDRTNTSSRRPGVSVRVPGDGTRAVATGMMQFGGKLRLSDRSTRLGTARIPRASNGYGRGALASGFGRPSAACDDWNTIESGDYLITEFVSVK